MRAFYVLGFLLCLAVPAEGVSLRKLCNRTCDLTASRCTVTEGLRFKKCRKLVRKRCRREGVQVCQITTTTTLPRAGCSFPCGDGCCTDEYPICDAARAGCCRPGYAVYCGDGTCCTADRPVCDGGFCYRTPIVTTTTVRTTTTMRTGTSTTSTTRPPRFISFLTETGYRLPTGNGFAYFSWYVRVRSFDTLRLTMEPANFYILDALDRRHDADPDPGFTNYCSADFIVPPNGENRCQIRFTMPETIDNGVIYFDDGRYTDSDPFLFR